MSTAFSKRMQDVGTRLLTKYGSTVNLVRAGSKVWDPVEGEYVQQPDTIIALKTCSCSGECWSGRRHNHPGR